MTDSVPQVHLQKSGGVEKEDAKVAVGKVRRSRRKGRERERSVLMTAGRKRGRRCWQRWGRSRRGCICECNDDHGVIFLGLVVLCV